MRLTKQLNYSKLIKCPVQMAPTMNTIKEKNSGKIRRFEANTFNSCGVGNSPLLPGCLQGRDLVLSCSPGEEHVLLLTRFLLSFPQKCSLAALVASWQHQVWSHGGTFLPAQTPAAWDPFAELFPLPASGLSAHIPPCWSPPAV